MRAHQNVDPRAHSTSQPPRASSGLRCKTGLRAGEEKKKKDPELYLTITFKEILVS